MASDYHKLFNKDHEKLILDVDKLTNLIKEQISINKELNNTVNNFATLLVKKDEQISKLILEIERLKNNNNKDSSNSSKPSSKIGFKNVKNSREKTERKQGGQKGHKGHTSKPSKVKKMIDEGRAKHTVIEVNKSQDNQNRHYKVRYVQDIKISTVIREYRYYLDSNGSYNIPKDQNNVVTYGSNIKAGSMLLVHRVPSSMDQAVSFLNAITNGDFEIKKSTLKNWTCTLSDKLDPLMDEIRQGLYNSYYLNTDKSPLNVNGTNQQLHNYSNEQYTLWI